jgi:hypothetical protein
MTAGVGLPFGRLAMTAGEIATASLRKPRNDERFEIATPAYGGLTAMDIGFQGSVSKNADSRFMLYIKNNLWGIR